MKRRILSTMLLLAAAAFSFGICSQAEEAQSEISEAIAEEETGTDEADLNPYTPEELAAVLTDYYIPDISSYVTLGSTSGFDVEESVYPVEDYDISAEIDSILYEHSEMTGADRPSQDGDYLTVDMTLTIDGTQETFTDYEVSLGYGEMGEAFDQNMTGVSEGDTVSFSETFGEDAVYEEWAGKTVDFEVTLTGITENIVPELTDAWVAENTDFSTVEEFRSDVTASIEAEYEQQARDEALDEVLSMAADACEFSSIPEDLTAGLYESTTASYQSMADMFGISLEELMEAYDISEEDIADEADDLARTRLFLTAYAAEKGLEITQGDVWDIALAYYEDNGYASPSDLLEDYGTEELFWEALRRKAGEQLLADSNVTKTLITYSEEDLLYDDSSFEDELYDDFEGSFEG